MSTNKFMKFPQTLLEARRRSGLRQKEVAFHAGAGTSYVCSLERGRRGVPADEIIDRLARAFVGWPQALEELRWAASHDRVVQVLDGAGFGDRIEIVSLAMDAARTLQAKDCHGLARFLSQTLRSSRFLESLQVGAVEPTKAEAEEVPIE